MDSIHYQNNKKAVRNFIKKTKHIFVLNWIAWTLSEISGFQKSLGKYINDRIKHGFERKLGSLTMRNNSRFNLEKDTYSVINLGLLLATEHLDGI